MKDQTSRLWIPLGSLLLFFIWAQVDAQEVISPLEKFSDITQWEKAMNPQAPKVPSSLFDTVVHLIESEKLQAKISFNDGNMKITDEKGQKWDLNSFLTVHYRPDKVPTMKNKREFLKFFDQQLQAIFFQKKRLELDKSVNEKLELQYTCEYLTVDPAISELLGKMKNFAVNQCDSFLPPNASNPHYCECLISMLKANGTTGDEVLGNKIFEYGDLLKHLAINRNANSLISEYQSILAADLWLRTSIGKPASDKDLVANCRSPEKTKAALKANCSSHAQSEIIKMHEPFRLLLVDTRGSQVQKGVLGGAQDIHDTSALPQNEEDRRQLMKLAQAKGVPPDQSIKEFYYHAMNNLVINLIDGIINFPQRPIVRNELGEILHGGADEQPLSPAEALQKRRDHLTAVLQKHHVLDRYVQSEHSDPLGVFLAPFAKKNAAEIAQELKVIFEQQAEQLGNRCQSLLSTKVREMCEMVEISRLPALQLDLELYDQAHEMYQHLIANPTEKVGQELALKLKLDFHLMGCHHQNPTAATLTGTNAQIIQGTKDLVPVQNSPFKGVHQGGGGGKAAGQVNPSKQSAVMTAGSASGVQIQMDHTSTYADIENLGHRRYQEIRTTAESNEYLGVPTSLVEEGGKIEKDGGALEVDPAISHQAGEDTSGPQPVIDPLPQNYNPFINAGNGQSAGTNERPTTEDVANPATSELARAIQDKQQAVEKLAGEISAGKDNGKSNETISLLQQQLEQMQKELKALREELAATKKQLATAEEKSAKATVPLPNGPSSYSNSGANHFSPARGMSGGGPSVNPYPSQISNNIGNSGVTSGGGGGVNLASTVVGAAPASEYEKEKTSQETVGPNVVDRIFSVRSGQNSEPIITIPELILNALLKDHAQEIYHKSGGAKKIYVIKDGGKVANIYGPTLDALGNCVAWEWKAQEELPAQTYQELAIASPTPSPTPTPPKQTYFHQDLTNSLKHVAPASLSAPAASDADK